MQTSDATRLDGVIRLEQLGHHAVVLDVLRLQVTNHQFPLHRIQLLLVGLTEQRLDQASCLLEPVLNLILEVNHCVVTLVLEAASLTL